MFTQRRLFSFLLIIITASYLTGCTKPDITFGATYLDNSFTNIATVDTATAAISTVLLDSFPTSGTGMAVAGTYIDPYFGTVTAQSYFSLTPPTFSDIYKDAIYDSLELVLTLNKSFYGDTTLPLQLNVNQLTEKIVIGWTGTHSTMKYLEKIVPVLQQLEQVYAFEFCVISNKKPELPLKSLVYVPWRKETEISDLLRFNIGVMPLEDDKWAKGKCAFKALQYMSLGIPAVVSPVGMNIEVVDHGVNGYVCTTPAQWFTALEKIILSTDQRVSLGLKAREKIENQFSVTANRLNFLGLFK